MAQLSVVATSLAALLGACALLPTEQMMMPQYMLPHWTPDAVAKAAPTQPKAVAPAPARLAARPPAEPRPVLKQRTLADIVPVVETPRRRLQCVPYARELSAIEIHGNAWTWWEQAEGRYARGATPKAGAVLVLGEKHDSRGHVAVVTEVLDARTIVVNHANWLNDGRIYKHMPVQDVSAANDWSEVRLWYAPGERFGASSYPVKGFIYPESRVAMK
jgi:hypothetical protein